MFFFMAGTSDCNSGIEYQETLICYDTNLGTRIYNTDTELYIIADFFSKIAEHHSLGVFLLRCILCLFLHMSTPRFYE